MQLSLSKFDYQISISLTIAATFSRQRIFTKNKVYFYPSEISALIKHLDLDVPKTCTHKFVCKTKKLQNVSKFDSVSMFGLEYKSEISLERFQRHFHWFFDLNVRAFRTCLLIKLQFNCQNLTLTFFCLIGATIPYLFA